jgi:hypothetical protein
MDNQDIYVSIDWLIDLCLTPTLAVFQLYLGFKLQGMDQTLKRFEIILKIFEQTDLLILFK